jgi:hypothetical protein
VSGDPFLDALNAQAGSSRLTSEQLAAVAAQIPGARVTSGQRSAAHNAEVGGVPNSQHVAGTALDFVAPGVTLADVRAKFPGETVLYHDAGSGPHFHVQGGGEAQPAPQPQAAAPAPDKPDPFLAVLDGATQGGASGSVNSGQDSPAASAGAVPAVVNSDPVQGQSETWGDRFKSYGRGLAALTPTTDALVNGRNFVDSLRDDATGAASGLAQIPATALHLGANVVGLTGNQKTAELLHRWGDNTGGYFDTLAADPNSAAHGISKLGSEFTAASALGDFTPLTWGAKAAKAEKLASVLARYGDMGIQGGIASTALSGGHDMSTAALEGAAIAPVAGVAGDLLLPPILKAAGGISSKVKGIASKLAGGAEEEAAPAISQTIRKGSDPALTPDGRLIVDINGGVPEAPAAPPASTTPKSATPDEIRTALGSRGSNSGLEANTNFPPEVAQHIDRLRMQGVPLPEAIREAEVTHVGAKPTIASVTRNPEDQAAVWEGAKQPTPEGRALAAQIAQNNAAAVGKVQRFVQDNGGVPAQGEAAETAAVSLAKASDAERTHVSALYKQARDAEGDKTVSIDGLRELLATPQYRAPTDAQSRELITGMNTLVKEMSKTNGNRFSPDQVESLRQAANSAYDRMGGSVNDKVGAIKSALDESLDQLENAGPAFKAARLAHKKWAGQYENPKGIASLIQRDAQGGFINSDNWRKADNFIGSTADKPFIQVVKQLQTNGDTQAIQRLKASVIQRAYERATNNATDKAGNATISGKLFLGELNKIGAAKLNALFSPAELADISSTGRAAIHMNEAVPGTVNTSHTASHLAKVLAKMGDKPTSKLRTAARVIGHGAGVATGHFGGNIAVEGINKTVNVASEHATAANLAKALRESMDPAHARAMQAAAAKRTADALGRNARARNISKRAAPIAAALREGKR